MEWLSIFSPNFVKRSIKNNYILCAFLEDMLIYSRYKNENIVINI